MPECGWPRRRCEQRGAGCTGASDAGAGRDLAGSKDGSLGKWCEGFDHVSRSSLQRHIIGCQTKAFLEALDALVRAPLPTRLAFAEGPHVQYLVDVGVRISSLTENNVFGPELVVGKRRHEGLRVSRMQERHDLLHANTEGWTHLEVVFSCIVHLLEA